MFETTIRTTTAANAALTTAGAWNTELFSRWVGFIDAAPKTVQTYTRSIKQFLAYLNDTGAGAPTRETVIEYREYLKQDHKPTTVQAYLAAVKLFFQWTEQEGLYPNVANRVKGAKLDTEHKKDYLTTRQVGRLLSGIDQSTEKGARDYAIIFLMVTTGLRTISIINADIGDLGTVGDSAALFYKGKGHDEKAECVKIDESVEKAIRHYLSYRQDRGNPKAPLFASLAHRNSGERMTTKSISRLVKEYLVSAGLDSDRLTAHSLRHTAATLNLLNGGSVEETKQMLGHKNINTTLIYSHALERAANNSEHRIAAAILGDMR